MMQHLTAGIMARIGLGLEFKLQGAGVEEQRNLWEWNAPLEELL